MKFELPELKYKYNELEPHIDEMTMNIHHTKHHATYVNNLNAASEKAPEFYRQSIEELIKNLAEVPEDIYWQVRNNGGGHLNHSFFWETLAPENSDNYPYARKREVVDFIEKTFGSFEKFQQALKDVALKRFGSGWVWLVLDKAGMLHISSSQNQDSPIMDGYVPLMGFDVWEHAYYLKYQNKRGDYIDALWNVVNWNVVEKRFLEGKIGG